MMMTMTVIFQSTFTCGMHCARVLLGSIQYSLINKKFNICKSIRFCGSHKIVTKEHMNKMKYSMKCTACGNVFFLFFWAQLNGCQLFLFRLCLQCSQETLKKFTSKNVDFLLFSSSYYNFLIIEW